MKTFEEWLKWLNTKGIKITIEHEYFREYYQNDETFEINMKHFNKLKK